MNVWAKNCAPERGLIYILQYLIQALQGAVFSRVIYHPAHFGIRGKLSTIFAKPSGKAYSELVEGLSTDVDPRRRLNSQEIHKIDESFSIPQKKSIPEF
jgi:hypothetical protein